MDTKNALACSYIVFEDYFGKHKTTIYRNLKILEENGFIEILKMGTSNVYIVNQDLAWSSYNTSKKYAKYDGNILVNKKENKDYEYRSQFERFKTENNSSQIRCTFCKAVLTTPRRKVKHFVAFNGFKTYSELNTYHTYNLLKLLKDVRKERSNAFQLLYSTLKLSNNIEMKSLSEDDYKDFTAYMYLIEEILT